MGILTFDALTSAIAARDWATAGKITMQFKDWAFEFTNGQMKLVINKAEIVLKKVTVEQAQKLVRKLYEAGDDVRELIAALSELGEYGPEIYEAILDNPNQFVKNLQDSLEDGLSEFLNDFPETLKKELLRWLMIEDDLKKFPSDLTDFEAIGKWALDFFMLNKEGIISLLTEDLDPSDAALIVEIYNQLEAAAAKGDVLEFIRSFGASDELNPSKLGEKLLREMEKFLAMELEKQVSQKIIERAVPYIGQAKAAIDTIEWALDNIRLFKEWAKGARDIAKVVAGAGKGNADDKKALSKLVAENLKRTIPAGIDLAAKQVGAKDLPRQLKEKIDTFRFGPRNFIKQNILGPLLGRAKDAVGFTSGDRSNPDYEGIVAPITSYTEEDGTVHRIWTTATKLGDTWTATMWMASKKKHVEGAGKNAKNVNEHRDKGEASGAKVTQALDAKCRNKENYSEASKERNTTEKEQVAVVEALGGAVKIGCKERKFLYQATAPSGTWTDYVVEKCKGNKAGIENPHGHHIVMKGDRYPENAKAREILCKYGINPFTDCRNLVISRNYCHSDRYAKKVLTDLQKADQPGAKVSDIEQVLSALAAWHLRCNDDGATDPTTDDS